MFKRLFIFIGIASVLAISTLYIQKWFIDGQADDLSYSIGSIYLFHFIAFACIIGAVELLSHKLPDQVGYFYLASIFVKIGLFVLVFKDVLFSEAGLNFLERISLIIPFFMFLVFEAIYSGRLMNAKDNQ